MRGSQKRSANGIEILESLGWFATGGAAMWIGLLTGEWGVAVACAALGALHLVRGWVVLFGRRY